MWQPKDNVIRQNQELLCKNTNLTRQNEELQQSMMENNLIIERQKCICDHIITMFDNPLFSDFKIVLEKTKECVHVLSYIMIRNKHFETFLTTKVGDAKKTLYKVDVENVKIVRMLAYHIYTEEFSITDDLSLNDFIDLVDLSNMWEMPEQIKKYLATYILKNWKRYVESDINNILILHSRFDSQSLRTELLNYMISIKHLITPEMLDWNISKLLPNEIFLEICVKDAAYSKLNDFDGDLEDLPRLLKTYYKPNSKIFTHKQLSSMKNSDHIWLSEYEQLSDLMSGTALVIESFVPFKARKYEKIGIVHGKSSKFKSILIKPVKSLKKTERIFFDDNIYEIKLIFWNTEEVDEAIPGESYSIAPKDLDKLPNRNTIVYRVENL